MINENAANGCLWCRKKCMHMLGRLVDISIRTFNTFIGLRFFHFSFFMSLLGAPTLFLFEVPFQGYLYWLKSGQVLYNQQMHSLQLLQFLKAYLLVGVLDLFLLIFQLWHIVKSAYVVFEIQVMNSLDTLQHLLLFCFLTDIL